MTAATVERTPLDRAPRGRRVLGIGGTLREGSSSELALRYALHAAAAEGASTDIITASELTLPMYDPGNVSSVPGASRLIHAARAADMLIISTPGYHGGMSGLLKNALDYLQELASDPSPYLHDRAVGCIVTAAGWQAGGMALASVRSTVHALRAWPTPLGVVINTGVPQFDDDGFVVDPKVGEQLRTLAHQVVTFSCAQ